MRRTIRISQRRPIPSAGWRILGSTAAGLMIAVFGAVPSADAASGPSISAPQTAPQSTTPNAAPLRLGEVRQITVPGVIGTVTERLVPGNSPLLNHTNGTKYAKEVVLRTGGILKPIPGSARNLAFTPQLVTPNNANGCTPLMGLYATCIHVSSLGGSGPDIVNWTTDAFYFTSTPCEADYYVAGTLEEEDYLVCDGPGRFYDGPPSFIPHTYSNGTQLCNNWPGAAGGEPCVTVKS
jgi:hypothetical protein